jgi:hypothetical protein
MPPEHHSGGATHEILLAAGMNWPATSTVASNRFWAHF